MQQAIAHVPGVESCEVNFPNKTATVTVKEGTANDEALLTAIKTALKVKGNYKVKS